MDLYALLGIEEKAEDKEVRTRVRKAILKRPGSLSLDASRLSWHLSFQVRLGPEWGTRGGNGLRRGFPDLPQTSMPEALTNKRARARGYSAGHCTVLSRWPLVWRPRVSLRQPYPYSCACAVSASDAPSV